MAEREDTPRPLHENLDTAYVNLAALLSHLEARGFEGLVRFLADDFEAEVILRAGAGPSARTRDHATGERAGGRAALSSLLARASVPGGLVSVYEGPPEQFEQEAGAARDAGAQAGEAASSEEDAGRTELLELAGELVGAVERAVRIAGGEFEAALHAARLRLAEDYPFLDPFARRFEYAEGVVRINAAASEHLLVSGITELLRGAVEHVADAERKIGVRKDAARELSILLRRRRSKLARFKLTERQLERIAGMKLL